MKMFLVYHGAGLFEIWRGPVVNKSNLHYERFYGFTENEQAPIWVLERTDPPENIVKLVGTLGI